jgi:glycerol uptake facilitator-like aquaporin
MVLFKAILAEFLGTFFFLSIILSAVANASIITPFAIAVGLLGAIYLGGSISGGHFNPAVSIMMFAKGNIKADVLILYILAQIIAGLTALGINMFFIS